MAEACYRCGGDVLATGLLISTARPFFRPSEMTYLRLASGDVMTKAMMCRGCGAIQAISDANNLQRLTSEARRRD